MISIMANNQSIECKWVEFSDGALTCRVGYPKHDGPTKFIAMTVHPSCPVKEIHERLALVISALVEHPYWDVPEECTFVLNLPYLPYGRADRVFEIGNPHGLFAFFSRFGMLNADEVHVCDPHNPKILPEIEEQMSFKFVVKDQLACFRDSIGFDFDKSQYDYVLAPDKGAVEKAQKIADWLGVPLLTATKERCIKTGQILSVQFNADMPVGSRVLVCDDICDGGGTFVPLGEELRSAGVDADIYFTHLIASKGLKIFKGLYDKIYYHNCVGGFTNDTHVLDYNQGRA